MDQRTLELLSGFSHEVRAPLGAIGGFAELLRMGAHGDLPEAQAEVLGRIIRNQRRVVSMLDALLTYSAALAGSMPVRAARLHVLPLVQESVASSAALAVERQRLVRVHDATDSVPEGVVDPAVFGMVMSTLLEDALAHSENGDAIEVVVTTAASMICITMSCASPPIDEASRESIFTPFRRGAAVRNTEALALPHSRALARLFSGDLVAVTGTERRTLRFSIPTADAC